MGKQRAVRVGAKFVQHIVPAVIKPLHALWNEVIGSLFLCFGGIFGFHAVRYAIRGDSGRLLVAGLAASVMLGYGVYSFLRARKISRS